MAVETEMAVMVVGGIGGDGGWRRGEATVGDGDGALRFVSRPRDQRKRRNAVLEAI